MNEWFECKIKYDKTMENGLVKKAVEPYLVDALNFTEAERRIIEEMSPFMTGEFQVSDIKIDLKIIKSQGLFFCFLRILIFASDRILCFAL